MKPDPTVSAQALAEALETERRSLDLYGYATAAPYLFIGGLLWLGADLLFAFTTFGRTWAWPLTGLIGVPAMILVGVRQSRRRQGALDPFWKAMGVWTLAMAMVLAAFVIFAPVSGREIHSFVGLVSGVAYALAGLWLGARILVTGLTVAVLSVATHLFAGEAYTLVMGLVGGGGMMLAAAWLRKA